MVGGQARREDEDVDQGRQVYAGLPPGPGEDGEALDRADHLVLHVARQAG